SSITRTRTVKQCKDALPGSSPGEIGTDGTSGGGRACTARETRTRPGPPQPTRVRSGAAARPEVAERVLGAVRVAVGATADLGDARAVGPGREAVAGRVPGRHVEGPAPLGRWAADEDAPRAQRVAVPGDEHRLPVRAPRTGGGPEGTQALDDVRERLGVRAQRGARGVGQAQEGVVDERACGVVDC